MADDSDEQQDQEPEVIWLSSECIDQITWNFDDKSTIIDFRDGRTVTYKTLPREIFDTLASEPSAGEYYNNAIKGQYA